MLYLLLPRDCVPLLLIFQACPGVMPIGVGETACHIVAKAVLSVGGYSSGLLLCAGHLSGCEAAVHFMQKTFASLDSEAVILVDATNALNRQAAIHNIQHLCPSFSIILINTYHENLNLYIAWWFHLTCEAGTT